MLQGEAEAVDGIGIQIVGQGIVDQGIRHVAQVDIGGVLHHVFRPLLQFLRRGDQLMIDAVIEELGARQRAEAVVQVIGIIQPLQQVVGRHEVLDGLGREAVHDIERGADLVLDQKPEGLDHLVHGDALLDEIQHPLGTGLKAQGHRDAAGFGHHLSVFFVKVGAAVAAPGELDLLFLEQVAEIAQPLAVEGEVVIVEADMLGAVGLLQVFDLRYQTFGRKVTERAFIEGIVVAEGAMEGAAPAGVQVQFAVFRCIHQVPGRIRQFVHVLGQKPGLVVDDLAVGLKGKSLDVFELRCAGLQVIGQFGHGVFAGADDGVIDVIFGQGLVGQDARADVAPGDLGVGQKSPEFPGLWIAPSMLGPTMTEKPMRSGLKAAISSVVRSSMKPS